MTKSPKSTKKLNSKKSTPKRPTRHRKNTAKPKQGKWLRLVSLALLIWCAVVVYASIFAKSDRPAKMLEVKKGDTYYGLLAEDKWQTSSLSSGVLAKLYLKLAVRTPLQEGVYQIPAGASLRQALSILVQGTKAQTVKVQIIEGKTIKDLYHTLKNTDGITLEVLTPRADGYSWAEVRRDNEAVSKALGITAVNGNLEGQFSPNTYFFDRGTTDRQILQKLYNDQQKTLAAAWENRQQGLPYNNSYEALIMASIIEKETGLADERHKVAAVFINRLRKNMRLQTDPTIIYGLFDRYDGKIYRSNIQEKTDYNTYQIHGLPPTPIALPSKAAIDAAMNPEATDVLFFVATGKGGHKFSRTLDEHNRAVAEYRAAMAKQSR
ncbi:endolytic transglycosylase MltG [Moraxella haemolytica]|uniref:endolytic transglycosylase MltG n=1 Tax=Moraxella haemolytica TaxID=2904119 RepID=UPI0025436474|nr:endolytic transglycosylase MltG [Moraxella sp. ZY171148]WII95165.1 endolytic transglycosylase MltG [Moraxella sp. ZY171148]